MVPAAWLCQKGKGHDTHSDKDSEPNPACLLMHMDTEIIKPVLEFQDCTHNTAIITT